jgi:hypothetical protein
MLTNEPSQERILNVTRDLLAEFGHEEYRAGHPCNPKLQYGKLEFRCHKTDQRFSIIIGLDVGPSEWEDPSRDFTERLQQALKRSGSSYRWSYSSLGANWRGTDLQS